MDTSTGVNDTQLKEALELLEQRQSNTTTADPELDTRFFNAVLLYLLAATTDHWWCSPQILPLARESLWLFSLPDLPYILKYKEKLNSLLQCCPLCVQGYYLSRNDLRRRYLVLYTPEQVNRLFSILEQFDHLRLEPSLTASATLSIDRQCCTVTELICFPYHLSQHDEQFCTLFDSVTTAGRHPTLEYTAVQSASLLVFHHHQAVRLWAMKLCETFAAENPFDTNTHQEDIDGLVAVTRMALSYFGQHSPDGEFELDSSKYYNMGSIGMSYAIQATQNDTNIWKGLRLVLNLLPDPALETLVASMDKSSSAPLFDILTYQLECTQAEINIAGLLKTMALLWNRLQDRFWGKEILLRADTKTYYTLLRQICDHPQFRTWVKIAQDDVGTLQAGDGTSESRKKLIRRSQGMVDWIFPFWCSLRKINGADYMTDRVLETLLSYFQLSTWTLSFRVCAAIVAFRIIQHTITENTGVPIESLNRLAHIWIPFAMNKFGENGGSDDDSALLPTLQLARESAVSILTDILCHDSRSLRDAYITLARSSSTGDGVSQDISSQHGIMSSVYPKVWDFLQAQSPTDISNLCPTLLSVYAPLVSIDNIQRQSTTEGKPMDSRYAHLFGRMETLCKMVSASLKIQHGVTWKTRKAVVHDPSMIAPYVSILAYSTTIVPQLIGYMTKKRKRNEKKSSSSPQHNLTDSTLQSLLDRQPQLTIAAITHVLTDFMELSNVHAETYNVVTTLGQALKSVTRLLMNNEWGYISELVKADENDNDQQIITEYWNSLWQVISTVFVDSYKWSTTHKPNDILDIVTLWMDIAGETMGCGHLFQCNDLLKMDSLASAVDGLSSWVYVTRRSLLDKLVPLLVKILRQLQLLDIKISLDAYDRLMSAVNDLNSTLLEPGENKLISSALVAHEPANVIVLDDSDDEYMEWNTLSVKDSSIASTTTLTSSAAPHTNPKAKMLQQSTTDDSVRKSNGSSKITGHIDMNNISANSVDKTNVESTSMEIDVDTFFDDWGDSEPPVQQKETLLKPILPPNSSSRIGEKRGNAHLFEPPHMATNTASTQPGVSGGSGNLQPSITKRQKTTPASDDSSNNDDDSDSGLLELMNMANKKQELDQQQQQKPSEKEQQQKNESGNLIALFATHQNRRPIKSTNSLESTHQFLQRRSRARQAERERIMKKDPNINQLFKTVLSWSLENVKSDTPPHLSSLGALCHVQDTYQSGYQGYFDVFEPLLLLEIWSQFIRAKETLTSSNVMSGFTMTSRCHVDDFVDVTFNVPIAIKISLAVDDLVCMANHFGPDFFSTRMIRGSALAASESLKGHQWHGKAFLGKVMTLSKGRSTGDIVIRCYFPQERITILNSLSPKSVWRCVKVTSLMMVQREYAALLGSQYYELANDLLHPHPSPMPVLNPQDVQNCTIRYDVNQTQATAIVGALNKPKGFTLIQGPPGTGKTKTILALLDQLLEEQKQQKTKKPGGAKILVCAPSNAAVDEIAKRLKDGIPTTDGLVKPKVVRIGVLDSVNASVKDLLLDRQVDKQVNPSLSNDSDSSNTMENDDNNENSNIWMDFVLKRRKIHETVRTLRLEMQQVGREACKKPNNKGVSSELRDRRKDLEMQLERQWTMLKELTHQQQEYVKDMNMSRARAKESILHNCDIVCTTLNGSGHNVLFEMNMVFDTVIVDEAAQAVEVSTLIPLKYDCKRCILVGDPNQLPPTVLSQLASKFDYKQSLFVRMEKNAPDNVYLLSIQYRMHPLISSFPSNVFYQSKLKDGPRMAEKTAAPWHRHPLFSPFMFFDVIESQEQLGRGASWYNSSEADAAVALVDRLATDFPMLKLARRIGIITPYKEQLSYLKLQFEQYFGSEITDVIDFNTVDGFQGQEKDIIIFSCVRSNSENDNAIGFLSDVRRMNVGLTRAKQSLFILGNADTLLQNQIWGMFVENARERGLLRVCQRPFFQRQLIPGQCPKNVFDVESTVVQEETPSQRLSNDYEMSVAPTSSTIMNVTTTTTTTNGSNKKTIWSAATTTTTTTNGNNKKIVWSTS